MKKVINVIKIHVQDIRWMNYSNKNGTRSS
jgi:hypothetical protein